MWNTRCTGMRQGFIWNQFSARVSLATPWMVCARARENFLFHAGSFDVSVVTFKPVTCDLAEAPMRDSLDFRWRSADVSSDLRMTKVSTLHFQMGSTSLIQPFLGKAPALDAVLDVGPLTVGRHRRSGCFQTRSRVFLSRTRSPTVFLCALLDDVGLKCVFKPLHQANHP